MNKMKKISKTFVLLLFYLLCNTINGYAQTVKEFRFSIKYTEVHQFKTKIATVVGVKGIGNGNRIRVAVFSEFNYFPTDDFNDKSFLIGFENPNTSRNYVNNSFGNITRPWSSWNPFSSTGSAYFSSVRPSNDMTYFQSQFNKHKSKNDSGWNRLGDETLDIVVRIAVFGSNPSLLDVSGIKIPGLSEFNPNNATLATIKVYRGSKTTPERTLYLNSLNSTTYDLVTYQGDKVVFEADNGTMPSVKHLTDTSVMRWAGECIFMQNTIGNQGEIKPFLFFDSNVHGVKMRKFPFEWERDDRYESFYTAGDKRRLSWIANGRYEFDEYRSGELYNADKYLKIYKKQMGGFANRNNFFGKIKKGNIPFQRNNQKEGLNMELLEAYECNYSLVAGLDPDELIYKGFNQSDIVNATPAERAGSTFSYIDSDAWKNIDEIETDKIETSDINMPLRIFLTKTGQFRAGNRDYEYSGNEIFDKYLYINKTGSTFIQGKKFEYGIEQAMFNNKVPVYYNPSITNAPDVRSKTLKFRVDEKVFNIKLAVLSPLEGYRKGKAYDELSVEDRKNPVVNFYGIINGPIHVSRYQKDVEYSVPYLPTFIPGIFSLVYTYEDSFGIIQEDRRTVSAAANTQKFNIEGGGYHDITLRYLSDPTANSFEDEVIIAGKELMDIDLRFIFSPNAEDAQDFSFNPTTTFKNTFDPEKLNGIVRLNENKANGEKWFLEDHFKGEIYSKNHGYEDKQAVREYTLDRDESIVLTVLDADPHTFVHYKADYYLSERRLSKRETDKELESSIEWIAAQDFAFTKNRKSIATGRYCTVSPKAIYPGAFSTGAHLDFYIKAVYKGTSEIVVKVKQKELPITDLPTIVAAANQDIGSIGVYNLSYDQYSLLKKIAPNFYTKPMDKYRIYKIKDLLSSYTFGQKLFNGKNVKRYFPAGMTEEVGEHKRFSDRNNYDARFTWTFYLPMGTKPPYRGADLYFDFENTAADNLYINNYQNNWFPQNWVRHLDSPPKSPEIPNDDYPGLQNFRNQTASLASYSNSENLFEPWQVRLPWIAQSGLHGNKTRWNIKCIYDIGQIFNKAQVGLVYGITSDPLVYAGNVLGEDGAQIINKYTPLMREMQEFYYMLKNKEMIVVDRDELQRLNGGKLFTYIEVKDTQHQVWGGNVQIITSPVARMAQGKNEDSLTDDANSSLCKVYPNPSSQGIFKLDINIPQENANLELQLADITGKIIYSSATENVSGSYSTTVGEKLNLLKGVYLLTIRVDDVTETKKLIVE